MKQMSSLPPNYTQTLRLIKTLRSLPSTGCGQCGYLVGEVTDQHNNVFPDTPLTTDQVATLLTLGARRGVFSLGGCSTGTTTSSSCGAQSLTTDNDPTNQLFYVNGAMTSVNPRNNAYVAAGYSPDPTQPRLGYLPCGYSSGGGVVANPYSGSGSISRKQFGVGGNAGTPSVGGCPSFQECGTCLQ